MFNTGSMEMVTREDMCPGYVQDPGRVSLVMAGKDVIMAEVDKGVGKKGDQDRSSRGRLAGQGSKTSRELISVNI